MSYVALWRKDGDKIFRPRISGRSYGMACTAMTRGATWEEALLKGNLHSQDPSRPAFVAVAHESFVVFGKKRIPELIS